MFFKRPLTVFTRGVGKNVLQLRPFHISQVRKIHPLVTAAFEAQENLQDKKDEDGNAGKTEDQSNKNKNSQRQENQGGPSGKENPNKKKPNGKWTEFVNLVKKCSETGIITFASLAVLVLGGIVYHKIYKQNVLWKMDDSFINNESLLLVKHKANTSSLDDELWAERYNQRLIDKIINGKIKGKYYLIVGEKGTGKTSTVMESITRAEGKDCAIIDCSSDIELMRLRIGNALSFEFFEDYIGSLFSMKGPRESTPILDIERAFMKLETILVDRKKKNINKPLILVFNNSHLIDASLVELLQQKAENFSSSGMLTTMFISDDYWLFEKLKTFATRLHVIDFEDMKLDEATKVLKGARLKYWNEKLTDKQCQTIYNLIGGRPQHLSHVASQIDMMKAAHMLIDNEKLWFLNHCALLGADMDDDVMESGKFATSAMLLMREFVEMDRIKKEREHCNDIINVEKLPELPLWRARQVMTRPDYIKKYDELNIFTIGTDSSVRADSVPMMRAFHEIASHPDFDDILRETIDRISEIESLGRTREVVFKDLALGGRFKIHNTDTHKTNIVTVEGGTNEENATKIVSNTFSNDNSTPSHDYHEGERKKWWKRRLEGYSNFDTQSSPRDSPGRLADPQTEPAADEPDCCR